MGFNSRYARSTAHTDYSYEASIDHASAGVTANDYHAYTGLIGHGDLARGRESSMYAC